MDDRPPGTDDAPPGTSKPAAPRHRLLRRRAAGSRAERASAERASAERARAERARARGPGGADRRTAAAAGGARCRRLDGASRRDDRRDVLLERGHGRDVLGRTNRKQQWKQPEPRAFLAKQAKTRRRPTSKRIGRRADHRPDGLGQAHRRE